MGRFDGAHLGQLASGAVLVRFVGVTTTFTLVSGLLAFSVRDVAHQTGDAPFLPIGHGSRKSLGLLEQGLADALAPIARTVFGLGQGAHVAAGRAIVRPAGFFLAVDMEASVFAIAFSATGLEATIAALFGDLESGRCGQQSAGDVTLDVQLAMLFYIFGNVGQREPHALGPVVEFAERFALGFFFLHASGAFLVRTIRVTTTLTLAVFLDTVTVGQTLPEFAISVSAPIRDVRPVGAIAQGTHENAPFAADQRVLGQRAHVAEFVAYLLLGVDRHATFFLLAFSAPQLEATVAALRRHLESGRCGD